MEEYRPLFENEAHALTESTNLDSRRGYRWVARIGNMIKQGREDKIDDRLNNIATNAGVTREVALKGLYELYHKHFFTQIERKGANEREDAGISWVQEQINR